MTHHVMKSWPCFFSAILCGAKTHDLRSMKDRDFKVGDTVTLEEFDPIAGKYSGRKLDVEITYITSAQTPCAYSSAALERGYCILSLRRLALQPKENKPVPAGGLKAGEISYSEFLAGLQTSAIPCDMTNLKVDRYEIGGAILPTEDEEREVTNSLKKAGLLK